MKGIAIRGFGCLYEIVRVLVYVTAFVNLKLLKVCIMYRFWYTFPKTTSKLYILGAKVEMWVQKWRCGCKRNTCGCKNLDVDAKQTNVCKENCREPASWHHSNANHIWLFVTTCADRKS